MPVSAWWKEVKLKNKLQQSGNERGQKVFFSMSGLGKKKEEKKSRNILSNLVKIYKKEKQFFLKIGYNFEN
jgi:hypothetical protein